MKSELRCSAAARSACEFRNACAGDAYFFEGSECHQFNEEIEARLETKQATETSEWIPAKEPPKESGDPVELMRVVHGKWRFKKEEVSGKVTCYCTACGRHSGIAYENQFMPYCPNCGARIEGPWTPSDRVFTDADFGKWIPVSERLPEHGEVVLCYMSFKDARALQWDNVSQWWLGYGSGDDWSKAKVTHWMPLPEPPKGE